MTRAELEQEYVNLYRRVWGTNEGLTTEGTKRMTDRQLRIDIMSLQRQIARTEPKMYEDQHIYCQDKPCGQAPLGCTEKRYCPKE